MLTIAFYGRFLFVFCQSMEQRTKSSRPKLEKYVLWYAQIQNIHTNIQGKRSEQNMKKKYYGVKRILAAVLAAMLLVGTVSSVQVFAAQTVYQNRTQEEITRGVVYEHNSRMTTEGIQDIYVLTVDLTESTLELKEVESQTE